MLYSKGSGIADVEQGIILFPLSKDLMLQGMWNTPFGGAYVQIPEEDVQRFNSYVVETAHREVYASVKSEDFMALVNEKMKD